METSPETPTDEAPSLLELVRAVQFRLEVDQLFGWHVPVRLGEVSDPVRPPAPTPRAASASAESAAPESAPSESAVEDERAHRQGLLDEIDREVRACEQCLLCESRTRTVFGVGDPCARLMFVGEGPGYDEDRLGEPFVGKAGRLLDKMIGAMGLERSRVYIANVVKCRPPENRNPQPQEMAACIPYLRQQIDIVRPQVICTLGNVPTRALLRTTTSISRLRGTFAEFEGIPLMPTFHPAYLLRNETDKRLAWDDLKKVMGHLGLAVPQRGR